MVRMIDVMLGMGLIPKDQMEKIVTEAQKMEAQQTEIDRKAKTLQVPESMTYDQAIRALEHRKQEEEAIVELIEDIQAFPLDGAHATMLVLMEEFGITNNEGQTIQGFFGEFKIYPKFVSVMISESESIQVPWGDVSIPGITGNINMGFKKLPTGRLVFSIRGKIAGKHKQFFKEFCQKIRNKVKTHSIYKGKALKISFRDCDGELREFHVEDAPIFMKLTGPENPIFTKSTEDQIELSILNPLRFTERLKKNGVQIKRNILLEGDYGTGKTLLALQVAREAVKHGWSFLYVDECEDLDLAMELADQYSPCVVFAEDGERVMGGERDDDMDELSYVLDGVDTKDRDLMVIVTTNKVDEIQKLMMRPGRIDSVISIQKPDVDTVWRLVQCYGKGVIQGEPAAFKKALEPMVGQNAAFIFEVVNKAKLRAIARDETIIIIPEDIRVAVELMQNHVKLMDTSKEDRADHEHPLSDLVVRLNRRGTNGNIIPQSELLPSKNG